MRYAFVWGCVDYGYPEKETETGSNWPEHILQGCTRKGNWGSCFPALCPSCLRQEARVHFGVETGLPPVQRIVYHVVALVFWSREDP